MKKKENTFTHEELVQLRQDGVISYLDYIQMHPDDELREDFEAFCERAGREQNEDAAFDFLYLRELSLDEGMERGDA